MAGTFFRFDGEGVEFVEADFAGVDGRNGDGVIAPIGGGVGVVAPVGIALYFPAGGEAVGTGFGGVESGGEGAVALRGEGGGGVVVDVVTGDDEISGGRLNAIVDAVAINIFVGTVAVVEVGEGLGGGDGGGFVGVEDDRERA